MGSELLDPSLSRVRIQGRGSREREEGGTRPHVNARSPPGVWLLTALLPAAQTKSWGICDQVVKCFSERRLPSNRIGSRMPVDRCVCVGGCEQVKSNLVFVTMSLQFQLPLVSLVPSRQVGSVPPNTAVLSAVFKALIKNVSVVIIIWFIMLNATKSLLNLGTALLRMVASPGTFRKRLSDGPASLETR